MPDNKQLKDRLRWWAANPETHGYSKAVGVGMREAADTIERLEAERNHWKASHDDQVRRKRVTHERLTKAEAERERDAAVLERLMSDGACREVAKRIYIRECEHPPKRGFEGEPLRYQELWIIRARKDIRAALQHAQEEVGESDG